MDGNTDRRAGTVSVYNGSEPVIRIIPSPDKETAAIAKGHESCGQDGYAPHEMGVFGRSQETARQWSGAALRSGSRLCDECRAKRG